MAKSKLIANRAAHAVALSNDGVASHRKANSKAKKDGVEDVPAPVPVAPVRPSRPVRRPAAKVEPVIEPVPVVVPAAPVAPAPRPSRPRTKAPAGPSLSATTQARMREMTAQLDAVRAQLNKLQGRKGVADAKRRSS